MLNLHILINDRLVLMTCDMYVQYDYITNIIIIIIIIITIFISIIIYIKTYIKIKVKLPIKHALTIALSNKSWMMIFYQSLNFNISRLLQQ